MTNQAESTLRTSAGVQDDVALPLNADLAFGLCRIGRKSTIRPEARQVAMPRRQSCQLRVRAQQVASASQLHDESLAVFAHELRSSLGAIQNAAHVLRILYAATSAGGKARLLIERQVGRMTRLVEDLVEVSQVKGAELPLQCERIDLCVVVKHAIETVESDLVARHHRLTISLPETPIWLQGDPGRLEQVLVNLLVNAAKYTDDGGDLSLAVEQRGDAAIVRIRDSGIGITADVLPNVFDLFAQADHSSRRAEAGLGIGLALVRRLVEMHGGSVSAASPGLGNGSEFTVRLPAA